MMRPSDQPSTTEKLPFQSASSIASAAVQYTPSAYQQTPGYLDYSNGKGGGGTSGGIFYNNNSIAPPSRQQ